MLNLMREIEKTNQIMKSGQEQYTPQFFAEIDAKIEAHVEQIINYLNREEEELQSKPVANLDRHYMVDESTSYHEQVITTLKNEEVVETHVKNRKEEQIEAPKALHRAKGEEMSTEAPSSSILILKMPYEPRAPIPGNLKFLFLETDNTLPVIIAYDLTRGEESGLLGLL
jgi:Neuraminidase (sialidase)